VYDARRVDSSSLVFSLSSYRHSYVGFVGSSRFIDSKETKKCVAVPEERTSPGRTPKKPKDLSVCESEDLGQ
jgi:hypothetical protein